MRSIRHPLSGALYDLQSDGTVRVEKDGKFGTFRADGSYISGETKFADPHMCVWIGGRDLPSRSRQAAEALKKS
ncbi:MAG: hypothetical protein Q7S58_12020 [Candidatus Binatus sp.]|uniref:hypothetical protein n=1 Tax=Candidatus Binatus sp. TaxID=2811406 RepID=UPI002720B6F5|nr:hypothetical protein [Candidatus Binatus sp.]MDO8433126.1 hypothetical protein [Candidatus Binatus sp.]